jgi:hypothetical protein
MSLGRSLRGLGSPLPGQPARRRDRRAIPLPHPQTIGMTGDLSSQLVRELIQITPHRRDEPYLHASDLAARLTVQRPDTGPGPEILPATQRVRFDIGAAVHDLVRDQYLGPLGRIYGTWLCPCGEHVEGLMPSHCVCCGRREFRYLEQEVRNEEFKVVGVLDCLEADLALGLGVLDIKSIESAVFRLKSKLPLVRDIAQVKIYLWLTGYRWGRLLYVSTGMEERTPFRDFVVRYDMRFVARLVRLLQQLRKDGR